MIELSHPIFPTHDIERTADFYVSVLCFTRIDYLNAGEPHICLYRDKIEIILTQANHTVIPNRKLYGYGYDAYFIATDLFELQEKFIAHGAKIARPPQTTDYQNNEFVVEDCDGRWIAFGVKEKK